MTNTVLRGPEFGKFLSFTKAKYALSTIYCSRDDTNGENSLHPGELNPSLRVLLILREKGSNAASSTQHTTSTSGIHEPKRRRANRDAAIRCQHMPATDEFLAAASCSSRSFMRQSFRRTKALLSGPRRKFLKKLLTCLKQVPYYIYYIYIIYIYIVYSCSFCCGAAAAAAAAGGVGGTGSTWRGQCVPGTPGPLCLTHLLGHLATLDDHLVELP